MTVAWCSRCRCHAPIDPAELTGDGGGDPSLLPVLIPPDGWIADADGEIVCGACATTEEIAAWMASLELVEKALDGNEDPLGTEAARAMLGEDA